MKKIFISTGELSGDKLGAWYLNQLQTSLLQTGLMQTGLIKDIHCVATGGPFLKAAGASIYKDIKDLSMVGIVEIIKHIPFIFRFLREVSSYIIKENFTEVILVDFPGFNLMLAKRLKRLKPSLKITYLSPPQLWVWGSWRVKKIRNNCDNVIVLYPFEVDWYKKRGVNAEWRGYPFYSELSDSFYLTEKKEKKVAILPGSRKSETEAIMPYFIDTIKILLKKHPDMTFIVPLAESLSIEFLMSYFDNLPVKFVQGEEKFKELATCCLAISKPGTATLQLAMLKIPTIIIYKASFITYWIARYLVHVPYMGLTNLLLEKEVCPELIQGNCNPHNIAEIASGIYEEFLQQKSSYGIRLDDLASLRRKLSKPETF